MELSKLYFLFAKILLNDIDRKWMKDLNDRIGTVDGRDIMVGSTYTLIYLVQRKQSDLIEESDRR
jgi:hypothetical protein